MALVRVKRRPIDDPADALLVTSKRLKTDLDTQSYVFKFAATVDKEEDVSAVIKRISSNDLFRTEASTIKKITDKLRSENKLNSLENRWKVVSCKRHCNTASEKSEEIVPEADNGIPLVDLEPEAKASPQEGAKDSGSPVVSPGDGWVYDYYYTSLNICDSSFENILSAIPVENELIFDEYRDCNSSDDNPCGDDEDSNDENHWKNDYPDEDSLSGNSDNDEAMMMRAVHGLRGVVIDSEGEYSNGELSTDDELVYTDENDRHSRMYRQYCYDSRGSDSDSCGSDY